MVVVHGKMVVFIGKLLFFMGTWPFFIWKLLFSIGKLLLFIGKLLFYGKTWWHMVFTCFYHVLMGRHHDYSWLYDVFECCFIKEDWDWVWHGLTDKHEDFKLQTCGWSKIMAQIQTLHRVLGPNRGHSKQYPTVSLIKFADFGAIGFDAPHFGAKFGLGSNICKQVTQEVAPVWPSAGSQPPASQMRCWSKGNIENAIWVRTPWLACGYDGSIMRAEL